MTGTTSISDGSAEAKFVQYLYKTKQIINAIYGHGPGNPWTIYVPEDFDVNTDTSKFIRKLYNKDVIDIQQVPCP